MSNDETIVEKSASHRKPLFLPTTPEGIPSGSMSNDLPAPPVPKGCNLRSFPDMPLEVDALRDSDLRRRSSGAEFKAAILLWCAAWHQQPCGSLPDDDVELADFAGVGTGKTAVRAWLKLRPMALRGWFKASDERLYHAKISEKALMAWRSKLAQRERTCKARVASLVKQLEKESDPDRRTSLTADLERARQEMSGHLSHPLSQGMSQRPTEGIGSDRIGSDQKGSDIYILADAAPTPPAELFAPEPSERRPTPTGIRTFADWRIMVGKRIFWTREEDDAWRAMFQAEGWDEMTRGYEHLAKKHPAPAKLFFSMFQEIR